jgi:hypothetical protein
MWQAVAAQAAMSALQGVLSGDRQMTAIRNRTARVNAEATNKVNEASNRLSGAQGSLARWNQSLSNQRVARAGGQALEASRVNYLRSLDSVATNDFVGSIRRAEEAGGRAAAAAVSGVVGDVVDTINSTVRLRDALSEEQANRVAGQMAFDAARQASGIMQQTISSMDSSLILDQMNYNTAVAKQEYSASIGQLAWQGAIKGAVQSSAAGTADFSMAGLSSFLQGLPGVGSMFTPDQAAGSGSIYALTSKPVRFGNNAPVASFRI